MRQATNIEIEGRRLSLTNLSKVLYPESGTTKVEVIDYYTRIAPYLLPHLKGRPITLKRYPDGIDGEFFYERKCPRHRPEWLQPCRIVSSNGRDVVEYCTIDDLPSLLWAANLASIELHPLLMRCAAPEQPVMVIFDLDPGPPATLYDCILMARELHAVLRDLGLVSAPKTSGSKGLHISVPLNSETGFEQARTFARAVALYLQHQFPDKVTSMMRKDLRKGKIFVDWSQNDPHKSTVAPYSLRATSRPMVSMPLAWEELDAVRHRKDIGELAFGMEDALQRVEAIGDPYQRTLRVVQSLPEI